MQNDGFRYADRIAPEEENVQVIDYYCSRYKHTDRDGWIRKITSGQISIDGVTITDPDTKLRGRELIYYRPSWIEPIVEGLTPDPIVILQEDEHFVVFHKPEGLPVLPSGDYLDTTLLHFARRHYRDKGNHNVASILSPIHRLGRGTTGAILFAKTKEASRKLNSSMQNHKIKKKYLALAEGIIDRDEFAIDQPLGPVPYPFITHTGTVFGATDEGKPSHSYVKVRRRDRENNRTIVEVEITTGRPHQIRIHMAWVGYPLCGDPLYGLGGIPNKRIQVEDRDAVPGDCGYLLHSWLLQFPHPIEHTVTSICCPPPHLLE
ncbi:pseudouridine synthase [Planoprotostelium fungivorum]|uniref:Pseudouridine synthase n=1 Tax=Planoprotostelium fungivorum TaxID=1890364 RepID=A0A2P6MX46_9EUKA|nr:pseudouridine synthase [Planoprotostelium fungivorum]